MNKLVLKINPYLPLLFQIIRFGIVGVTAVSINFLVVVFLVQTFALPPLVANLFGFAVAFQASYWGHRKWTFNRSNVMHSTALPKLLIVQLLALSANETLFYIFLSMNIPYQFALLIVLSILPIFTFLSSKLWVFRSIKSAENG